MLQTNDLRAQWEQNGFFVVSNALSRVEWMPIRQTCDRIHAQVIAEQPEYANATNIAFLTEPRYFEGRRSELITLLEFIAHPNLLALLRAIAPEPPLFHNTQYFVNPNGRSWEGAWHRDTQFGVTDAAEEQRRMAQVTGIHVRVAFEPDEQLEIVPGSHHRWDTPEESAIRSGPQPDAAEMPGRYRIQLDPGDICVFHAWSIHRGTYSAATPRCTFDIIYGLAGVADWAIPTPTCFQNADLLSALAPNAQAFYQRFIDTYTPYWGGPLP